MNDNAHDIEELFARIRDLGEQIAFLEERLRKEIANQISRHEQSGAHRR